METVQFPFWRQCKHDLEAGEDQEVCKLISAEMEVQNTLGMNMLKFPGICDFPRLLYSQYGYENYLMAYALYPDVIQRGFQIQADTCNVFNHIVARAVIEGGLPRLIRLDHDMAGARGTLVDIKSLDQFWFPQFARSIRPLLDADIRLMWHCDGNLWDMIPRLIEVGISGFQGFQYEYGMDYERICKMTDREGNPLSIIAGVSVTRTLPKGTPADVKRELDWVVEHGPQTGLMLGCTSSIAPGVPMENLRMLLDGLAYYRNHGRSGKGLT
jgi:hypothetical protein